MSTKATASIRLNFNDEKQIRTILGALTPEANAPPTRRAVIKLNQDGLSLVVSVEAEDTVALRATLNAYLRWISSTVSIMDLVDKT